MTNPSYSLCACLGPQTTSRITRPEDLLFSTPSRRWKKVFDKLEKLRLSVVSLLSFFQSREKGNARKSFLISLFLSFFLSLSLYPYPCLSVSPKEEKKFSLETLFLSLVLSAKERESSLKRRAVHKKGGKFPRIDLSHRETEWKRKKGRKEAAGHFYALSNITVISICVNGREISFTRNKQRIPFLSCLEEEEEEEDDDDTNQEAVYSCLLRRRYKTLLSNCQREWSRQVSSSARTELTWMLSWQASYISYDGFSSQTRERKEPVLKAKS